VTWPVFHDGVFRGVYHRLDKQIHLFEAQRAGSSAAAGARRAEALVVGVESAADLAEHIGESGVAALRDEIELLDAAGDHFDPASFEAGELSPMFFGSAINNFGLQTFLDTFCDLMPPPRARSAEGVTVSAVAEEFSGFIFKIQANMNRAHRDRVAFIRICSGRYVRDMKVLHVATGREVRLANPAQFFAAERSAIDEAFAGDVIGVYDPGSFEIGDTLTAGSQFEFDRIPSFAPEHFSRMVLRDAMRRKQLVRGLDQLAKEGVIQLYRPPRNRAGDLIVGTVGQLQLEVTRYRLKDEYGAEIRFEPLRYQLARWVSSRASQPLDLDALGRATSGVIVHDVRDRIVVLFENEWNLRFATERLPDVEFAETAAGR
jgi:peptide chain release factor 3